jgi:hypothetical protein
MMDFVIGSVTAQGLATFEATWGQIRMPYFPAH